MKEKIVIAGLIALCVAFALAANYFRTHPQKIIVNLTPVGNNSGWVPSPYDFK
jgi:hypothetical protein